MIVGCARRAGRLVVQVCLVYWVLLGSVLRPARAEAEPEPATATALPEPTPPEPEPKPADQTFRLSMNDLDLREDKLAYEDAATLSVQFKARADHMLTHAELDVTLARPTSVTDLQSVDFELNGERVLSIPETELGPENVSRHVVFDAAALASANTLTIRIHTAHDPGACGRVPVGTWRSLQALDLVLNSMQLPLPANLAALPLPFLDPDFDREQVLDFVVSDTRSPEVLRAASLVAAWFALRGRGRLTFRVHVNELPAGDAIVLLDSAVHAGELGLGGAVPAKGALLALYPNPQATTRQLLVLSGSTAADLLDAARLLLRDGYSLSGDHAPVNGPVELPTLAPYSVPRWAPPDADMLLGNLPEKQPLRLEGGHSGTLQLSFRLVPDLFVWPSSYVDLELHYAQGISPKRGPAHVNVAWNGNSIGMLPAAANGKVKLPVPRHLLRGYNELLLQISYDDAVGHEGNTCANDDDAGAWFGLQPDSMLRLSGAKRFALVPDLVLFLYDGFPFTVHGDLRTTTVMLPSDPEPGEVAAMLDSFAHFASVTGAAPTAARIVVGNAEPDALRDRDALIIARAERHPLLDAWRERLPLVMNETQASVQYPSDATLLGRWLSGSFGDAELSRANAQLNRDPFGAVFGIVAPWDPSRSVVVLTASDGERLPRLSRVAGYAQGHELRNDLMIVDKSGLFLFQIGVAQGRGELPTWILVRVWFANHWPLLPPVLLLSAAAWGWITRQRLAALARRRVREVTS